jgi:hypothetical protein
VFWKYLVRTQAEKWDIQTDEVSHCLNIFDTTSPTNILEVPGSNNIQETGYPDL